MNFKHKKYLALPMAVFILFGSFFGSYQKAHANPLAVPLLVVVAGVLGASMVFESDDDLMYASGEAIKNMGSATMDGLKSAYDGAIELGSDTINLTQEVYQGIMTAVNGLVPETPYTSNIYHDNTAVFTYTTYDKVEQAKAYSLGTDLTLNGNHFELINDPESAYGMGWNLYYNGAKVTQNISFDMNGIPVTWTRSSWNFSSYEGEIPFFAFVRQTNGTITLSIVHHGSTSDTSWYLISTSNLLGSETVAKPEDKVYAGTTAKTAPDSTKDISLPFTVLNELSSQVSSQPDDTVWNSYQDKLVFDTNNKVTTQPISEPVATPTTEVGWLEKLWNSITKGFTDTITAIKEKTADFSQPSNNKIDLDRFKALGLMLAGVFPFSIPWDIITAIDGLVANPTPPKFVIDLTNTPLVGGTVITLDFAKFEAWAKISRWGTLIAFNIGLIVLTRKIIS
jgi:hypothetical protein